MYFKKNLKIKFQIKHSLARTLETSREFKIVVFLA